MSFSLHNSHRGLLTSVLIFLALSVSGLNLAAAAESYIYGIDDVNDIWQVNPEPGDQTFVDVYNTGLTPGISQTSNAFAFDRERDQMFFLNRGTNGNTPPGAGTENNLWMWNKPLGTFVQIATGTQLGIAGGTIPANAAYYANAFWFFREGTFNLVKAELVYASPAQGEVPTLGSVQTFTVTPTPSPPFSNRFGDIAINPTTGLLFAATSTGYFYSVDLTTASAGSVSGFSLIKSGNQSLQIAFNGDYTVLYGHNYDDGKWFAIDTSTGTLTDLNFSTLVGNTNRGFRDIGGASIISAASADLVVLKNGPTVVSASGDLTWTVTVTNAGPSSANGAVFSDNVPAGVSNFSWTCDRATGGAVCPNASGTGAISQTIATFPAGSSLTYTLTGTAPVSGSATNTAMVTPPDSVTDPDLTNNEDSTITQVSEATPPATADLSVTKYGPASVAANGQVTYQLLVVNAGYSDASGAVLTDAVPVGLTGMSWTCASAVGGAECPTPSGTGAINQIIATFPAGSSLTYTVTGTAGSNGTIRNVAEIAPPVAVADPNPNNNRSQVDTVVQPTPAIADLSIIKTGSSSFLNGQPLSYTLLVSNEGPSGVTDARVIDALPPELQSPTWTCEPAAGSTGGICALGTGSGNVDVLVTLPPGARIKIVINATAPVSGPASFANVAEVFPPAGTQDPIPENNISTAVITQLILPVAEDDSFNTLVNVPVEGTVVINDTVPTGSTFAVVTQPSHGSVTLDASTGAFTYTPNTGFTGTDSFTYQICLPSPNQTVCDSATVTIIIPYTAGSDSGSTTTAGNPDLLNVLDSVTYQPNPNQPPEQLTADQANIEKVGTWPNGITLNEETGQVGVRPGTRPGTYQVVVNVCENSIQASSMMARANTVANLTLPGQCALVTLDITVTPPPPSPNPIPTLSEWAQIMMMLAMIATAGFYGWRMKQR